MKTTKFLIAAAVFALCLFSACSKNETDEATKSQVESLVKQVDSLKTVQNSIKESLAELGLDVDVVADTVDTLVKKYQAIDLKISDIVEEVTELNQTVEELQKEIDGVKAEQKTMFVSINARLSRLENRVQSIVVIPDYSTGEIKVDVTKTYIIAHIRPFAVADSLVKLHAKYENIFKVAAVQRETKAIPVQNLSIDTVEFHPTDDSTVMIKADVAELSLESNNYVVSLSVTSGNIQKQSEYFPLKQTFPDSLSFWGTPQKWDWEKPKQTIKRVAPGIYEDTVSQYEWPKVSEEYYSGYFFTPWASADIDGRYFKTYTGSVSKSSYENQIQFLYGGKTKLGSYSVRINLNEKSIAAYYNVKPGCKSLEDFLYFVGPNGAGLDDQRLAKVDFGKYTGFIYVSDGNAHGQLKMKQDYSTGALNAGDFQKKTGVTQGGEEVGWDMTFDDGEGVYWMEVDLCNSSISAMKMKEVIIFGAINDEEPTWEWKSLVMTWNPTSFCYKIDGTKIDHGTKFWIVNNTEEGWNPIFGGSWENVVQISEPKAEDPGKNIIEHNLTQGKDLCFYPTRKDPDESGEYNMYCYQEEK